MDLKMVKAMTVSVTVYQIRSWSWSISAGLILPKKILLISLPAQIRRIKAWKDRTVMLRRQIEIR